MNAYTRVSIGLILFVICIILIPAPAIAENKPGQEYVSEWQIHWVEGHTPSDSITRASQMDPDQITDWVSVDARSDIPTRPDGAFAAWVKLELPLIEAEQAGILLDTLYAQDFTAFLKGREVFTSTRDYLYYENRLLIPLQPSDSGEMLYILVSSKSPLHPTLGIGNINYIGDYQDMLSRYMKTDLPILMLGASLLLLGVLCVLCSLFLDRNRRPIGISLGGVHFFSGMLFITYSPFMFMFFAKYGELFQALFDLALLFVITAFLYFFEQIFGPGKFSVIKYMRVFQTWYSILTMLMLLVNIVSDYRFTEFYYTISVHIFGVLLLIELVFISIVAIVRAFKRDPDAVLFSAGIGCLVFMIILDMVMSYTMDFYNFVFWRWGILGFLIAQFVLLGGRLASDHRELINYSKRLELFNQQLQRTEKMEIISELAASIAHEVRNPLQVTRGFLQLFSNKSAGKEKGQMQLAMNELDRATEIISDFLTFSKPELEEMRVLDVKEELGQIEGIIVPLTHINGGNLIIETVPSLHIFGNSSRFKQALINIIKNSIEAFTQQGRIVIRAEQEGDDVVIRIQDNGIGMTELEMNRLGEPYFSTKTNGTGLGMMVTFRIIELMHGQLQFSSTKGVGTVATLRFPIHQEQEEGRP